MPRSSRHTKEELRALIVTETLDMVRRHGSRYVTARRIAQAIGYTPGMLYSAFANLQEILLHVNTVSLESLRHDCVAARLAARGPADSIRAMGIAYVDFAERHTDQFELMFKPADLTGLSRPPRLLQTIASLFCMVERDLAELAPSTDFKSRQLGARALWSAVHGTAALTLSRRLYLDGTPAGREILDASIDYFLAYWQEGRAGRQPAAPTRVAEKLP